LTATLLSCPKGMASLILSSAKDAGVSGCGVKRNLLTKKENGGLNRTY